MKKLSLLFVFVLLGLFGAFASSHALQEDIPGTTAELPVDMAAGSSPLCAKEDQSCFKNFSPQLLTSGSAHANRSRAQSDTGNTAEVIDPSTRKPVTN